MASTALFDINQLTLDSLAVRDLCDLLVLETLQLSSLSDTVDINTGVLNGQHVGGIGEFDPLGTSQPLCNPVYGTARLATREKTWSLGDFTIAQKLCADDFLATVAKFNMNSGTDAADLSGIYLVTNIIVPRLQEAIEKALWRVTWFGDTTAEPVEDDGLITDGVDVNLFKITDGLFKRLMAIAPSGSGQQVLAPAIDDVELEAGQEKDNDNLYAYVYVNGELEMEAQENGTWDLGNDRPVSIGYEHFGTTSYHPCYGVKVCYFQVEQR